MSRNTLAKQAINTFIIHVASAERAIELHRQMLAEREDFEPYSAFKRICRHNSAISSEDLGRFCRDHGHREARESFAGLIQFYDIDCDGMLSYREFLEFILPRDNLDLRAFVAQKECISESRDGSVSKETQELMVHILDLEVQLFRQAAKDREKLEECSLSPNGLLDLVEGRPGAPNANFKNLNRYLAQSGLLIYEHEIINFIRKLDRDDDGVVNAAELNSMFRISETFSNPESRSVRRPLDFGSSVPRNQQPQNSQTQTQTDHQSSNRTSHSRSKLAQEARRPEKENRPVSLIHTDKSHPSQSKPLTNHPKPREENDKQTAGFETPSVVPTPDSKSLERRVYNTPAAKPQTRPELRDSLQELNPDRADRKRTPTRSLNEQPQTPNPAEVAAGRDRPAARHTPSNPRTRPRPEPPAETRQPDLRSRKDSAPGFRLDGDWEKAEFRRAPILNDTFEINRIMPPAEEESRDFRRRDEPARPRTPLNLREYQSRMKIREQNEDLDSHNSSYRDNDRQEITILNGEPRPTVQPVDRRPRNASQKDFELSPKNLRRVRDEEQHRRREAAEEDRSRDDLHEDRPNDGNVSFRDRILKTESNHHSTPEKKPEHRRGDHAATHSRPDGNFRLHSALENPTFTQTEDPDERLELYLAVISNLARHEVHLETAKKKLIARKDFAPLKLFDQIDKKRRGWFTMDDFKSYLASVGLKDLDSRFLLDLYSAHDLNHNCLLNLHEFTHMIASENPEYSQMLDRPVTDREKVAAS